MKTRLQKNWVMGALLAVSLGFTVSCGKDDDEDGETNAQATSVQTIAELADQTESLSTLYTLIGEAGLADAISDADASLTVFAPSNDAFEAISEVLATLTQEQKTDILLYHIIEGGIASTDLVAEQSPVSLSGDKLFITKDESGVKVNGAVGGMVTTADVQASNGYVHIIDAVLLPDEYLDVVGALQKRYNYSSLVEQVVAANLSSALQAADGVTIFAPNNAAFAGAASSIASLTAEQVATVLQYHVLATTSGVKSTDLVAEQAVDSLVTGVSGGLPAYDQVFITSGASVVQVNGSAIVEEADIIASNGVIHGIDALILPDAYLTVAGIAAKRYSFTSLVGGLQSADLLTALSGSGPFTVFAPINSAFAAIQSTVDGLSAEQLSSVLQFHVIAGTQILSSSLSAGTGPTTLEGSTFDIAISGQTVTLGSQAVTDATVTATDIVGSNGVVHVIDGVLIPTL